MLTERTLTRALSRGSLILTTLVLLVLTALLLKYVLVQVFVALIVAAGMAPIVAALSDPQRTQGWRWRPPRALVVLAIYAVSCSIILVTVALLVRALTFEGQVLLERMPEYASTAQVWIDEQVRTHAFIRALGLDSFSLGLLGLDQYVQAVLRQLAGAATLVFSLFGGAVTVLFVLFMALYLTVDRESMLDYLLVFAPEDRHDQLRRVYDHIWRRLSGWVIGQSVLSIGVGIGAWIGLAIIGVPGAATLGVIWAVAELIPGIGPFISAVPSILLGFTVGPTTGLLTALFSFVWSQVANSVMLPRVMSRAVKLHPLVVLLSILIGHELLGIVGALISVPVAAACVVVVDELRNERLMSRQATPRNLSVAAK